MIPCFILGSLQDLPVDSASMSIINLEQVSQQEKKKTKAASHEQVVRQVPAAQILGFYALTKPSHTLFQNKGRKKKNKINAE